MERVICMLWINCCVFPSSSLLKYVNRFVGLNIRDGDLLVNDFQFVMLFWVNGW